MIDASMVDALKVRDDFMHKKFCIWTPTGEELFDAVHLLYDCGVPCESSSYTEEIMEGGDELDEETQHSAATYSGVCMNGYAGMDRAVYRQEERAITLDELLEIYAARREDEVDIGEHSLDDFI